MTTSGGRELGVAVVVGAGAVGLALLAASRTWVVEQTLRADPLPPLRVEHAGSSLVPVLPAVALVGLAGLGALLATRGRGRLIVGVALAASGLGVFLAAFAGYNQYAEAGGWALLAMLAGLVLAGVGMTALRRGASWPAMSTRYERSAPDRAAHDDAERAAPDRTQLWDAIERGDDPTLPEADRREREYRKPEAGE
jgi:hypothetical protein